MNIIKRILPYLSWIYKQTIAWKWTSPLKILQYQYPYTKQLKHSLRSCVCLILQNRKIGEKKLANCCDSPNLPKFFPLQSFLLYGKHWFLGIVICTYIVYSGNLLWLIKYVQNKHLLVLKIQDFKVARSQHGTKITYMVAATSLAKSLNFNAQHHLLWTHVYNIRPSKVA